MNIQSSIFLFVIFVFCLFSCESSEEAYIEPVGLLYAQSFEEETNEFSPYSNSSQDYKFEWTEEEAFDGKQSLIIEGLNNSSDFAFWWIPFYDFEIGKPLKARIRVKTKDINGSGFAFNMFARVKDVTGGVASGTASRKTTDGEWITIETELNKIPEEDFDRIDLYMLLSNNTTGIVYFDKLEIFTE